jgi:hypothetical protein
MSEGFYLFSSKTVSLTTAPDFPVTAKKVERIDPLLSLKIEEAAIDAAVIYAHSKVIWKRHTKPNKLTSIPLPVNSKKRKRKGKKTAKRKCFTNHE